MVHEEGRHGSCKRKEQVCKPLEMLAVSLLAQCLCPAWNAFQLSGTLTIETNIVLIWHQRRHWSQQHVEAACAGSAVPHQSLARSNQTC